MGPILVAGELAGGFSAEMSLARERRPGAVTALRRLTAFGYDSSEG
jgi:hypothetical protein